jgi:hypothetical protein
MQDWNAYRDTLLAKVADYGKLNPDVVLGLLTLTDKILDMHDRMIGS